MTEQIKAYMRLKLNYFTYSNFTVQTDRGLINASTHRKS
jgi:hypothetical protein